MSELLQRAIAQHDPDILPDFIKRDANWMNRTHRLDEAVYVKLDNGQIHPTYNCIVLASFLERGARIVSAPAATE